MDETIYVIFKVQFDFALEVWFSIFCKRQLNVNFLCFDDVTMKWLLQSTLKSFNYTAKLDDVIAASS